MKEVRRLPNKGCHTLQFSPDGKTLAGFGGSAIHLWNVADGKPLDNFDGQTMFLGVVYSTGWKISGLHGRRGDDYLGP